MLLGRALAETRPIPAARSTYINMHDPPRGRTDGVKGAGLILAAAVAAAALGGCSRPSPAQTATGRNASPPADYLSPPEVVRVVRDTGGAVALSGTGSAGAVVRLSSPDGSAMRTAVDRTGAWSLTLPAAGAPRLFSLSQVGGGRLVRARGYLAVLPAPGPAAMVLRPATAAAPIASGGTLSVSAIDFDASGAAVVSGRARPNQTVRLMLDGSEAGEDRADAAGRFDVSLPQALKHGPHVLTAAVAGLRASATLTAASPAPIPAGAFAASRLDGAWRIDWITPGGGVQSTVVFDPRGGRA
jgi:hypothetical protein